jgi:hypothetical protein
LAATSIPISWVHSNTESRRVLMMPISAITGTSESTCLQVVRHRACRRLHWMRTGGALICGAFVPASLGGHGT